MTDEVKQDVYNFVYQPLTSQEYQYKIYINDCESYIGSELVEQFRNDHLIEANPNIIIGSSCKERIIGQPQAVNIQQGQCTSGINYLVDINNERFYNSVLLRADIILFCLNRTNIQEFEYILKLLKNATLQKQKKLICISSVLSWGKRKSNTPNQVTNDLLHLRNSLDYHLKSLEDLCLAINHQNQNVQGSVIFSGLVYGLGEQLFLNRFKQALDQQKPLKIYGNGTNLIPTIHLKDLAQIAYNIAFRPFSKVNNWHFACDSSKLNQKQIIKCIAQNLGNGDVLQTPIQQSFINDDFDEFTVDLQVKDCEKIEQWHCKQGLKTRIQFIVGEFNEYRGLKPNKILIIGPPASGKSTIADIIKKNYGLPIINIKNLIQQVKKDQTVFGKQIQTLLQQIKAQKIQQERKIYEEMKKKKKGKGVDQFDPSKIVPRLTDQPLKKIIKWRLNFSDCINKGYILDSVIKNYKMAQGVFQTEEGTLNQKIFPNTIFTIKGTDDQVKQRVKGLPIEKIQNSHWTEEQTTKRLQIFHKQNEQKTLISFFNNKVDVKEVEISYQDHSFISKFIERNGPLGFKKQVNQSLTTIQNHKQQTQLNNEDQKEEDQLHQEEDQKEEIEEEFNLLKLTDKQQKILNQKSRPIRQYLIDNVIPEITEGLLEICKQIPNDPIQFLIGFLQKKNSNINK